MQIRERKTTWALIRTRYDASKKRGVAKCIGTVSRSADALPEGLAAKLTEDERVQIEKKIREGRAERDVARRDHYAAVLPTAIDQAAIWYLDPRNAGKVSAAHAHDTRDAFSRLLAAMVKARVGRRRKRRTKKDAAGAGTAGGRTRRS